MQVQEQKVAVEPRTPVRWGALLGGFVVLTAVGWLLTMLGAALGFTIADATDAEAIGAGLGLGTSLWFVRSWIAAYFIGALVTARLAAAADKDSGMLHGLTLWGLGSTVSLLFGLGMLGSDEPVDPTRSTSNDGGLGAVPVALALAAGEDVPLPEHIDLDAIDVPPELERAAQNVAATVKREASALLAAQTELSRDEARSTLEDLDAEVLQDAAVALIEGEPERARDVVAANTTLTEAQIETLIANAEQTASARIDTLQQQLASAAEAASTYITSLLWAVFIACAAALAASIGGGVLGAATTEKLLVVETRTTTA